MIKSRGMRDSFVYLVYMFPALFFLLVLKIWPLFYSFFLSFNQWNFIGKMKWVGLKNYAGLLTRDEVRVAFGNTFLYIFALIPFYLVIPLIFAVILTGLNARRAENFYKALLFLPAIVTFSIVCTVWGWIFHPSFGVLNKILGLFNIPGFAWLTDRRTAFWSVVIISGWKNTGYHMILFYAGLITISKEYLEAAMLDGASAWQTFWKIKWPLLSPTTSFIIITSVIFAAEGAFTPINILTGGGPGIRTVNLTYVIYNFGFYDFNIGLGSAAAIFAATFFFIINRVMMKTIGENIYYDN